MSLTVTVLLSLSVTDSECLSQTVSVCDIQSVSVTDSQCMSQIICVTDCFKLSVSVIIHDFYLNL